MKYILAFFIVQSFFGICLGADEVALQLVNGDSGELIGDIDTRSPIDLNEYGTRRFYIRPVGLANNVESVVYVINDQRWDVVASSYPFDLTQKDGLPIELYPGQHTVTLKGYSKKHGEGEQLIKKKINFSVSALQVGAEVISVDVIDSEDSQTVATLEDGGVIYLSDLQSGHFYLQLQTSPEKIHSYSYKLDNKRSPRLNTAPYYIGNHQDGEMIPLQLGLGEYTLSIFLYGPTEMTHAKKLELSFSIEP